MGKFAEAAIALKGRFSQAEAHLIAGALHAPSVVSLGLLKIHTADKAGALEAAEIAKIMLQARAPVVRHHAMWYLALLALSQGDPMRAHGWLSFGGHEERLAMFPLYPHEVAYDAERVRVAAAVGDEELADHAISLAERRASRNPDVASCAAAAAHARGIWATPQSTSSARSRSTEAASPSCPCVRARRPRPGAGPAWGQRGGDRRA